MLVIIGDGAHSFGFHGQVIKENENRLMVGLRKGFYQYLERRKVGIRWDTPGVKDHTVSATCVDKHYHHLLSTQNSKW